MSEPIVTLRHVAGNTYEDVKGGREPYYLKFLDGGQYGYMHETGYGYHRAEDVRIEGDANVR